MTKNDVLPRSPKPPKRHVPVKNTLILVFALLSLFIAIGAFITAQLSFYRYQQARQIVTALEDNENTRINEINTSRLSFKEQVTKRLQTAENNLNQLLQQANQVSASQAQANAQQLLRLAQLQITFNTDAGQALHLLEMANQQIAAYSSAPKIRTLQDAINQDILTLKKVPPINFAKRLSDIDTIIQAIKAAPTVAPPVVNANKIDTAEKSTHQPLTWQEKINNNLAKLSSLISIRRIDSQADFLLTPDQMTLAKQVAITKLLQAQWAILNGAPTIFKQGLLSAKTVIEQLDLNQDQKTQLSTLLDSLLKTPISEKLAIQLTALSVYEPENNEESS